MTMREHVLQEALALPPEDRAFLAEHLEQSLHHGEFALPEVAAAWTAEIDRRIAAYDRGEIQASDADVVPGVPFEPADDKRVLVSVHIGERLHDAGEPSIRGNLDFEAIGLDDKEIPIEREPGP